MGIFSKKPAPAKSKTPVKPKVQAKPQAQPQPKPKDASIESSALKMKEVTETIRQADNLNDLLIQTSNKAKEAVHADRITIFVVDSIKHGMLVYKDGEDLREIAVLSESEQKMGQGTGNQTKLAANISHKRISTHD